MVGTVTPRVKVQKRTTSQLPDDTAVH
jgi:hypothetical protein